MESFNSEIDSFINAFNEYFYDKYPQKRNSSYKLIEEIQNIMIKNPANSQIFMVEIKEIEQYLTKSLQETTRNNKNGILIIGPPGIGKTAFMKYYAQKNNKFLINVTCCELVTHFRQNVYDTINILFLMSRFSNKAILFFDQIDLLMNPENSLQKIQDMKKILLKNIQTQESSRPVVYSTNRPWKIENNQFLDSIYSSIQIPIFGFQKRKTLIEKIFENTNTRSYVDLTDIKSEDIAKRTQNYLNSDLYVLIRQILLEPIKQELLKGRTPQEIQKLYLKVTQQNVENAFKKIRPSIQTQQLQQYDNWLQKFQKLNVL